MHRDIPNMVASAQDCSKVEKSSHGGCASVVLDEVMSGYEDAFRHKIAPALGITEHPSLEKIVAQFQHKCDPSLSPHEGAPHGISQGTKSTFQAGGRDARLRLLSEIDRTILNGEINKAKQDQANALARSTTSITLDGNANNEAPVDWSVEVDLATVK